MRCQSHPHYQNTKIRIDFCKGQYWKKFSWMSTDTIQKSVLIPCFIASVHYTCVGKGRYTICTWCKTEGIFLLIYTGWFRDLAQYWMRLLGK
jgi:hypothetical protein